MKDRRDFSRHYRAGAEDFREARARLSGKHEDEVRSKIEARRAQMHAEDRRQKLVWIGMAALVALTWIVALVWGPYA